jgi:hypothetical protein
MIRHNLFSVVVFLCALDVAAAYAQEVRILSASVASPRDGLHDWYSAEADPEDANNLITCGSRWDAKDNAYHGFVYSSQDAGKTWRIVLEDKSSRWVSEESCAFGVHGVAYFVADASKVDDDGDLHHDQGTTRIWVSHDSGRNWSLGTTAGWTDCSSSVVDRNPGSNQNRLYIFFNNLWDYYGSIDDKQALDRIPKWSRDKDGKDSAGSSVGLISYREGDHKVAGPVFNSEMYRLLYHGAYTHQNLMLKDGSLLTLFWSKRAIFDSHGKRSGREFIFSEQHTDPNREKLADPVALYTFLEQPENVCDSYLSAPAVYDSATNTVYATYLDGNNGKCKLMLTKSTDDGQSWSPGHEWTEVQNPRPKTGDAPKNNYRSLALARNQEGVIALLWRNDYTSNCWFFAASTGDVQTYSHPVQISPCSAEADREYHIADSSLAFGYTDQADESKPADDAVLQIKNSYNAGASHVSGIAVSRDGVFHPVWITSESGEGQLQTAAIAVIKPKDGNLPEPARTDGWQYTTNKVKFAYGGSQHYDPASKLLTESVVIRNSGTEILRAPLRLDINPDSRLGIIYPLDVTTEGFGQDIAQYLDIAQYIPGDGLPPGASSTPIPLNFHFEPYSEANPADNIISTVSLRLLTRASK